MDALTEAIALLNETQGLVTDAIAKLSGKKILGDRVLQHLPLTAIVDCYSIDCCDRLEYYGSGTLAEFADSEDDDFLSCDFCFEVAAVQE